MLSKTFGALLVALLSVSANAATIQKPGLTQSQTSKTRAAEIKAAYRTSYQAYLKYASGHDALLPLTNGFTDPFGGWGASVVDSLSTSFLMGHNDLYTQGVEYAKKIDFSKTSSIPFRCSRPTFGTSLVSSRRTSWAGRRSRS